MIIGVGGPELLFFFGLLLIALAIVCFVLIKRGARNRDQNGAPR